MKKYKLIKKYPGSPRLGTEMKDLGNDIMYSIKSTDIWRCSEEIKNHPEFWEEVVEKDYEILSFGYKGGADRILKNEKYCYSNTDDQGISLQKMLNALNHTNYYIKSVKRLSDGEIFTIGDSIDTEIIYIEKHNRNIKKFVIKDGELLIFDNIGCLKLEYLNHYKKPLFTTEDGVDIYEGDKVWGIIKDIWKPFYLTTRDNPPNRAVTEKWLHGKFSTKGAAEEYILMNRPCLCVNDIIKLFGTKKSRCKKSFVEDLKKLVNNKTNGTIKN